MATGLTNCILRYIKKEDVVLALGIGIAQAEDLISENCRFMIGVDIFRDYLHLIKDKIFPINFDVLKLDKIFVDKCADVVLALDLIEHLEKPDGFKLIEIAEKLARRMVIFYTPCEFKDNKEHINIWGFKNEYQLHKSLWTQEEFTKLGYEIDDCYKPEGFIAIKKIK
ncbi:MAG: hypothetical protein DRM99_04150 [Thermoplasmata archaeon]|nr:MAG: hypothetical protein DRM99_04150 [Thermoplasmata archaeon]